MKRTTVMIILDAARDDYVNPDSMPFLSALAARSPGASFRSPPGFAQRTVLFTGRYPDTSGNLSAFAYDPDGSPFRWVEAVEPLARLVRPWRVMWPARLAVDHVTGWLTEADHTDPAWIPPSILPFFRPCEDMRPVHAAGALGAPSVFDLCREADLRYRYLAHPVSGDDDEVHRELLREIRSGDPADLVVAQFSATDERGHHHGPHSATMREEVLPELDRRLAGVHGALEGNVDAWDLLVLGDHGMAPVEHRVNVLACLEAADARHGEDYVAFVNSTLVVLWYLTPRGRREVERVLPTIPGTRLLDEAQRAQMRIPTDEAWGHRMVAAEPGVLFWPDYFHVTASDIRGMHGYLDKATEGLGLGVLASNHRDLPRHDLGPRPLVDVFPTLCHLLGVPLPPTNEGASLVEALPASRRSGEPPGILAPTDGGVTEPETA